MVWFFFQDYEINVSIDGIWSSNDAIFNYDTDMSVTATARTFAKQEWNRQFFKDLEKWGINDYEDFKNILIGTIKTIANVKELVSRKHAVVQNSLP